MTVTIIREGYWPPRYRLTCGHCGTEFVCDDDDTTRTPAAFGYTWEVPCPLCKKEASVTGAVFVMRGESP